MILVELGFMRVLDAGLNVQSDLSFFLLAT